LLKTSIIWLDEIVEKIAWKHTVERHEVHEVFDNRPHVRFIERGNYPGEDVYAAYGQTLAGRYLVVFFINKQDSQVLPLSARDMTEKERKYYEKT
jgi:hypothetical protein